MSRLKARPRKTVQDYLELADDVRAELIEGEIFMTPSPSPRHQDIVRNVFLLLHAHVSERRLGRVFFAPLDIFLPSGDVVQPDVVFVSTEGQSIVEDRIRGVPDLLVEVLSPTGAERDRLVKRDLYAANRVPEYWIVDDDSRSVDVLSMGGAEVRSLGYHERDEEVLSEVVRGFRCRCDRLFA